MNEQGPELQVSLFRSPWGEVWLERTADQRTSVVKRLRLPDTVSDEEAARLVQRLAARANALGEVQHKGLQSKADVEISGREAAVTTVAPQGRSLKALLDGGARFSESDTLAIVREMAGASVAMLDRHVQPATITPQAVFVEGRDAVLVDLALAQPEDEPLLWQHGAPPAEVPYMAPECLKGEPTRELAVVWSLGVLAFKMLSGRLPFEGADAPAILRDIGSGLNVEAALAGTCRAGTAKLVREMLEADPRRRRQ